MVRAIFTTGGYLPKNSETGQAIAADWEAIGLKTKIEYVSSDKWLDDILAGGEKTRADSPAPMTYVQLDYHSMYAARVTSRIFSRTNKMSALGKQYPDIDAALATAQGSFDVPKATAAFEEVYKEGCEEALYIPLIDYPDIWGAVEGVKYEAGPGVITRIHLDRIHVE